MKIAMMSLQVLVDEGLRGHNWLGSRNGRIPNKEDTGIVSELAKRGEIFGDRGASDANLRQARISGNTR
jgi:hypothetical protein